MQFQTLITINGPVTSILPISRSIEQKVCILGQLVGDFKASNDDPMISVVDPWYWQRSADFVPWKSNLWKTAGAKHIKTRKRTPKMGFWRKSDDPDFHGHGDHGAFSPFQSLVFGRFSGFFYSFFYLFFLTFLHLYWPDFPEENLMRSRANQSVKFLILRKSWRLCCRFVSKAKVKSNDVGMTWNLKWSLLSNK